MIFTRSAGSHPPHRAREAYQREVIECTDRIRSPRTHGRDGSGPRRKRISTRMDTSTGGGVPGSHEGRGIGRMRSPERDLVAHRLVAVGAISLSFLVVCCPVAFWADRGVVFSRTRFGVQYSTRVRGSHV